VTDRASFSAFIEATVQLFGVLDVLVNVGIQYIGPFVDESDLDTDRQPAVNRGGGP